MGRMKDVAIDIENLLNTGMSEKDIATKTGMPIEQVREVNREVKNAESKPEFKASVERAIRGGGGGSGAGVDIEGLPKKLKSGPKNMKKGGKVSSASKRADGIAIRGKTRA